MNKYCTHVGNVKSHVLQTLKYCNLIVSVRYCAKSQTSKNLQISKCLGGDGHAVSFVNKIFN